MTSKVESIINKSLLTIKMIFNILSFRDLVKPNEDLLAGGKRILKSLTSLENIYLKQFHTFGNPERTKQSKKDQSWLSM